MPRTLWSREYDEDKDKSDSDLRNDAEQRHWSRLQKLFAWVQAAAPADEPDGREASSDEVTEHKLCLSEVHGGKVVSLSELSDDVARTFCFKDCALYATAVAAHSHPWRLDLYSRIYRRWFPSRAEDTDISHDNFFCSLLRCCKSDSESLPAFITQIVGFHTALCEQLKIKIPDLPPVQPTGISGRPSTHHLRSPPAIYHLRPTFEKCLLIVHAANHPYGHPKGDDLTMEEPGAIVVWLQPNEMPPLTAGMIKISEGNHHVTYQCDTLDTAMHFILSTDPARSVRRREWHGHYKEVLDQNDPIYGNACQCTFCS